MLAYRNMLGSMEWDQDEQIFYGRIRGIPAFVWYDGKTATECEHAFQQAVDEWIRYPSTFQSIRIRPFQAA